MKLKILLLLLFIIIINCEKNNENIDIFLDWGLKNKLQISSYIEVSSEKNKIKFIAKEDIPKKKELLTIPNKIMFNISKALELINSKNLNKQYKQFEKLNLTYKYNTSDFRKEESFITYIFYLIQHKPKKYQKTKFFEFFEKYLESLDKYTIKSPLYYEQEQIEFLSSSFLSRSIETMKNTYEDEIHILSNDSFYKKDLDFDDYVHHRFPIHNKGLNISNHWTLVPFLNIIDEDYTLYNANYTIEENGDVKILSRRNIKRGDEIVLKSVKMNNIKRFLYEGKTNEKLYDYYDEYNISAFSRGIYYYYKIKDHEDLKNIYVNIKTKDFDSIATGIYLDYVGVLNGDGSDTWAYDVLDKNLKYYKEYFERLTLSKIYEYFSDKDDRINIERIIRGEKKMIERALKRISKTINQFMQIQSQYMSGDNKNNIIEIKDTDL